MGKKDTNTAHVALVTSSVQLPRKQKMLSFVQLPAALMSRQEGEQNHPQPAALKRSS